VARPRNQGNARPESPPGRLRIVAGKWRSRLLDIADAPGLRPTSERIRETLFNWLAPHINGARCLDLFAGTGALGLEALSRGASSTVFVEKARKAAAALEHNVAALGADGADVRHADAFDFLRQCESQSFDIVFLDPPFVADALDELCRLLNQEGVLADGCLVYLEQDRSRPAVHLPDSWQLLKSKTAGNVRYSLARVLN
jgi:16S rRNA (guanine966-N2)-methyltransferase